MVVPCQKAAEVVEKDDVTKPASLLKLEMLRDARDVTPVPPFATERMPLMFVALIPEVADTTPALFVWRKPAPVPRVRALVDAPALNVCSCDQAFTVVVPKPIAERARALVKYLLVTPSASASVVVPAMTPATRLEV